MIIKLPLDVELTEVEKRLPEGVQIGEPGIQDDGSWLASHPALREEDEVYLREAVKRPRGARASDPAPGSRQFGAAVGVVRAAAKVSGRVELDKIRADRADRASVLSQQGAAIGGASSDPIADATTDTLTPTRYVATSGSDAADGLTTGTAWQTLTNVNSLTFTPGLVVAFNRGDTFTGNLLMTSADNGTLGSEVGLTAYGTGARPVISATTGHGIAMDKVSHIIIEDLDVVASRASNNSNAIFAYNSITDTASGVKVDNVTIRRCKVSNADWAGIHFRHLAINETGYDGVVIDGCEATGCGLDGILLQGRTTGRKAGTDVYNIVDGSVLNSISYSNNGGFSGALNFAGNGIRIMGVDTHVTRNCRTYLNGGSNAVSGGGPVGNWVVDCKDAWIRECTSYENGSAGGDGGGFDIDGMCKDCGVERCFSYRNQGAGFFHAQFALGRTFNDSINPTFRFNLSIDDVAQVDGYTQGAITISGGPGADPEKTKDVRIYHNTVVTRSTTGDVNRMLYFNSAYTVNGYIMSNIMLTTGFHPTWHFGDGPVDYYTAQGLNFESNLYHQTASANVQIYWDNWGGTPTTKTTIAAWGQDATPVLTDPGLVGTGSSVDPLDYALPSGTSSAKNAGSHIAEAVGLVDFFGNVYPAAGPVHIGAQVIG